LATGFSRYPQPDAVVSLELGGEKAMNATQEKTVIWVIVALNYRGNTIVTTYQSRETAEIDLRTKRSAHPHLQFRLVEVDFE
jgi:hypothetical protein